MFHISVLIIYSLFFSSFATISAITGYVWPSEEAKLHKNKADIHSAKLIFKTFI